MVVVDGDGEDWASEESIFILVPANELLQSDRDDPEREILLQKPLILQKLSRQQNFVEKISDKKSVVSCPWSQSSGVSHPGIDDFFNYVVDRNSTK
jgi:hypothetical protein